MQVQHYRALLEPDGKGGYGVVFPDFPGCVSVGADAETAVHQAAEALALHIEGMLEDPLHRAMVEAINQVGHVMGLVTVAESVESRALMEALREIGVDHAQGHGIDTPKPLHQVLQLPEQEWNSVRLHASGTAV